MRKKNTLQKFSIVLAIISAILSISCVVYLYLNLDRLGWEDPISASLLASSFFFVFICFVFFIIGTSNIPSFKIEKQNQ